MKDFFFKARSSAAGSGNVVALMRILGVVCLLAPTAVASRVSAQEHDTVWVWNSQCPTPTRVAIRVRLDQTTVYEDSLQVCRWERRFENGKASFRFTATRPLVWREYLRVDTTKAGTPMRFEFWQAGGERDAIVLGYAILSHEEFHTNWVHVLLPTQRSTSAIAPGLLLETWPKSKP
jgi:hypothetical protein